MKKKLLLILSLFVSALVFAQNVDVEMKFSDKRVEKKTYQLKDVGNNTYRLFIPLCEIPTNVDKLTIIPEFARAKVGDEGYFVLPNGVLTKFKERKDGRFLASRAHLAVLGSKTPAGTYAAIVKGMPYSFSSGNFKKGNNYHQEIFFNFKHRKAYDDIFIDYVKLEGDDANYSGMGKAFRNYKLASGAVKTIREKVKTRPALEYCVTAPEIRIRQGWKPAPPKVRHQTLANEPEMKVVVTFDRVGDIVAELKKQGVDKAQLCLVGWNIRGHDGRYPQMFPVESALGGEAKLRSLIKNTLADGYQIVCHTNSTDAYEIADSWDEEYIIKNPDGSLAKNETPWSGGEMYQVCWRRAYERFGIHDLKKVADLGFKGMHYIDVVSCVPARDCFDPRHPTNPNEASWYMNKIFDYCNDTFGGSMSEGGYDHCFGSVDSILYVSFILGNDKNRNMLDRFVPLWQIAYHGIVLSNPGPYTVNYKIKEKDAQLKFIEFGGRPNFYFHSKFREGASNWMGENDITCQTDEKLKADVALIKEAYDEHNKIAHLQYEFMDFHDEIAPNVFITRYSDGTEIITNYTTEPFLYKNCQIEGKSYRVFKPSLLSWFTNLF